MQSSGNYRLAKARYRDDFDVSRLRSTIPIPSGRPMKVARFCQQYRLH